MARLEFVEHLDDAIDVRVVVVEAAERTGESHPVARIISLVELLAARKRRHRGIEGEAKNFDARYRMAGSGLQETIITLDTPEANLTETVEEPRAGGDCADRIS